MRKKNKALFWILLVILAVLAGIVLGFSKYIFNIYGDVVITDVCGNKICDLDENINSCPADCLNEDDFVFTYWPINARSTDESTISNLFSYIDKMKEAGMNYASISFRPISMQTALDKYISKLREKGYKIALEVSAGQYTWGGETELLAGDDDNKFLKSPCINKNLCDNWNNPQNTLDPSYTGTYWQNTLRNTKDVLETARPDMVLFDMEIWRHPSIIETFYKTSDPGRDCNCEAIASGIGFDRYIEEWRNRGLDVKQLAKTANPSALTYFYDERKIGQEKYFPNYNGKYTPSTAGYMPENTGDYTNPSFYFLPNLDAIEINKDLLKNALPWVSFDYTYGYSNYNNSKSIIFDPSVSREAGRMLRKAGARGFVVYRNAYDVRTTLDGKGAEYWLAHAKAMVNGFQEGLIHKEANIILNGSFESLIAKADSSSKDNNGISEMIGERLLPTSWKFKDNLENENDSNIQANVSTDKIDGTYSWRHSLLDNSIRTITNKAFNITQEDEYLFNLDIKSTTNGEFDIYLASSNEKFPIINGQTSNEWTNIQKKFNLKPGNYSVNIVLSNIQVTANNRKTLFDHAIAEDSSRNDFYLDNIMLTDENSISSNVCGNKRCDPSENADICSEDCPKLTTLSETTVNQPVIESVNLSEGQTIASADYYIEVKAHDNEKIEKIEFYVDNILIDTNYSPDISGVYDAYWETGSFINRTVVIKIIAYNNQGQTSQVIRSVNVLESSDTAIKKFLLPVLPKTGKF